MFVMKRRGTLLELCLAITARTLREQVIRNLF